MFVAPFPLFFLNPHHHSARCLRVMEQILAFGQLFRALLVRGSIFLASSAHHRWGRRRRHLNVACGALACYRIRLGLSFFLLSCHTLHHKMWAQFVEICMSCLSVPLVCPTLSQGDLAEGSPNILLNIANRHVSWSHILHSFSTVTFGDYTKT